MVSTTNSSGVSTSGSYTISNPVVGSDSSTSAFGSTLFTTTVSSTGATNLTGPANSSAAVKITPTSNSLGQYNGISYAATTSGSQPGVPVASAIRANVIPQQSQLQPQHQHQMYRQNVSGVKPHNGLNLDSPSSLTGSNHNGSVNGDDYPIKSAPNSSIAPVNSNYNYATSSANPPSLWHAPPQNAMFRQVLLQSGAAGSDQRPFGSLATSSAAVAAANLGSLSNSFMSEQPAMSRPSLIRNQSPAYSTSSGIVHSHGQAFPSYGNGGNAFHSPMGQAVMPSQGYVPNQQQIMMTGDHRQQSPAPPGAPNSQTDKVMSLQRELDQERSQRVQLQQRLMEMAQRLHAQPLLEKSYEDLVLKYKHVVTQLQQVSPAIERYKSIIKQLEQEKSFLMAENSALKSKENVALHDKTLMYNILLERSKKLEEENSSLVLENETYQRQYEKSIDEISKQVVQALLTQKALQEQCLQLQERLVDVERENIEYGEVVRQARQASSDSKLGWSYKPGRNRAKTASPSADSVRSMPAQHLYWRQGSINSLEHQQQSQANGNPDRIVEHDPSSQERLNGKQQTFVCMETEFPANNGSPKSTRRNLERHPSSGSLDSSNHNRGFVKQSGQDVRCQRSVSAEALRDLKVNMRRTDLTLPSSVTLPLMQSTTTATTANGSGSTGSVKQQVMVDIHQVDHSATPPLRNRSSANTTTKPQMTDSGVVNDPFAEDADDILSKHQSLIIGSTEDIFSTINGQLANDVIHEEDPSATELSAPTPPPRPRSRCLSDSSYAADSKTHYDSSASKSALPAQTNGNGPPPLPPKQYKGSRRVYKPLPAEPVELDVEDDSSDKNTDSESIKQEINALTSQISRMAASAKH